LFQTTCILEAFVNPSVLQSVYFWDNTVSTAQTMELLGEEPLSIRVEGKPYSVIMRTPGEEIAHVAGFCLGEGIIDTPADYTSIAYCDAESTNVVTVTLTPSRRAEVAGILDRRNYISQTSCGLCGKELVQDLYQLLRPVPAGPAIGMSTALAGLKAMSRHQPLRDRTHASHAAALWDAQGKLLAVAEDIGRHNGLDKAIGKALIDGSLPQAALVILSSRVSYELVQKAARARIPAILSVSRPTGLAVELSSRLNMGLACLAPKEGAYVFCGKERFRLDS
jgi:FdhD protein